LGRQPLSLTELGYGVQTESKPTLSRGGDMEKVSRPTFTQAHGPWWLTLRGSHDAAGVRQDPPQTFQAGHDPG